MHKDSMVNIPNGYYDPTDSQNRCFLCSDPDYSPKCKITHFGIPVEFMQCKCGIIKQTPMPNEEFFSWFFNSDIFIKAKDNSDYIWGFYDYLKDEPSRLATSKLRYSKLKRKLKLDDNLSILKIGPSTGTFLHVAKEKGHDVYGCDISDMFSKYAKANYDIDIDIGRFEKLDYGKNKFDMIVLFNVIENIPNLDEFMKAVHRSIKPGGYFVFNHVPMDKNIVAKIQGGKYFMFRPPICYMFDDSSMKLIEENYGFCKHKSLLDIRFMTPEKMLTLLGWRTFFRIVKALKLHRLQLPVWAYPSRVTVFSVKK